MQKSSKASTGGPSRPEATTVPHNDHIEGDSFDGFEQGPDQIIPTEFYRTWNVKGAVKLRVGEEWPANIRPVSAVTIIQEGMAKFTKRTALSVKREGRVDKWTYAEYMSDVRKVAKAFIKLGLQRFNSVCILGFNSPEWFISCVASIFAGGLACGIYTTNSADASVHVAVDSCANIIVTDDETQMEKFITNKDKLPNVKAYIQYLGESKDESVLTWAKLLEIGSKEDDSLLDDRIKRICINQCCTLIYTSGTTGTPKGAMLSHDNICFTMEVMERNLNSRKGKEIITSYLPLSHVAAQMSDIFYMIYVGGTVHFAQRDALKGTLGDTLKEVRPTIFLAVPRVWEKIQEKMLETGARTRGLKRCIGQWAKNKGWAYAERRMKGRMSKPCCFGIAQCLVFRKVKLALGLDRCNAFLSGAAPLCNETMEYFASFDIIIREIYGMSESTGPEFIVPANDFRIGSAGKIFLGTQARLDNPDEDGNGEICMSGRNVFMGYLGMKDRTYEMMDEDGWLKSGDIGRLKGDWMYITGRIKELIVTAGGEKVPPLLLENAIKSELPCVSHVMLVGDKRKFISCVITLQSDVDSGGYPMDTLSPVTKNWLQHLGSNATTVKEILEKKDPKIYKAIQEGIGRANSQALSHAQNVQKFVILPVDFSIPGGELGPTLKLKRHVVEEKYSREIESMYA